MNKRILALLMAVSLVVGLIPAPRAASQNELKAASALDGVLGKAVGIYEGHTYALFDGVASTWEGAKEYCESMGGHLATITSVEENTFLYDYMQKCGYANAYWGLTDHTVEGVWEWCTGEPVIYLNWASGEPNNDYDGAEDYGMFWDEKPGGGWNDGIFGDDGQAFLCEWDCVLPEAKVVYNDHDYLLMFADISSWEEAQAYCESLGGHLATITSAEENNFIYSYVVECGHRNAYFGLTDRDNEGTWEWCTGEPVVYTNWPESQPSDSIGEENYGMYWDFYSYGEWNDGGFQEKYPFICEWDFHDENVEVKSGFTLGIDNNSFMHTGNQKYGNAGFVGVKDYTISDEYFKRLTECSSKGEISSMKKCMKEEWEGSCYGIAMTMGLLYEEYLDMSDLTNSNASTYYSLAYPYKDPKLLDAIGYFQLSQSLTIGGREYASVSTTCSNGWFTGLTNWLYGYDSLEMFLQKLVSYCSNGHILVFGYSTKTSGHAILVTGCEFDNATQEYVIEIYDENTVSPQNITGGFGEMRVSKDYSDFTYRDPYGRVKLSKDKYCTMYFLNWESLASIISSLKTKQQNLSSGAISVLDVQSDHDGYAILEFPLDSDGFTISNVNGEYLSYDGAYFSGTMPIYAVSTEEYDTESRIRIETDISESFIVTDMGAKFELEVYDKDDFMSITGSNISGVTLDAAKGIEIEGDLYSFKAYISTDEIARGEDGLVSVSASTEYGTVIIETNGNTVTIDAEAALTDVSTETYIGTKSYIQDFDEELTDFIIEATDTTTNRLCFTDVPTDSFYYTPVLWALDEGITSGTTPTEFSPYDSCLRSQVVTFLWRAAGKPKAESAVNPFVDVKPTDYYYDAVLWAVEKGITTGADATHFEPNGVCNRSQVVTFLYRAFGKPPVGNAANPFTDVKVGSWYADPVLWAVNEGITNGLSATEFGPNEVCNRSQVVTFLYRAYE